MADDWHDHIHVAHEGTPISYHLDRNNRAVDIGPMCEELRRIAERLLAETPDEPDCSD